MLIGLAAATSVATEKVYDWTQFKSPFMQLKVVQNDDLYPKISGRIVGGSIATVNQFPHQVALFADHGETQTFCGGSIVGKKLILTAAQCLYG